MAVVLAAAALPFLASHASAQTNLDLFAGAIGTPASLSINSTVGATATTSGVFGVDGYGSQYNGTVSLNASALNTFSEGFAVTNGVNTFSLTQSGAVTAGGTATAAKSFGPQLQANTTYAFTLTRSSSSTVQALGSFNISLSNGNTVFVDTATGQGLSGTVNVLNLFGSNGVATFTFTTPSTYVPANSLGVTFTDNLPANAAGGTLAFSGASIGQVPEPHTVVAMLLGMGGLVALRIRRRLVTV